MVAQQRHLSPSSLKQQLPISSTASISVLKGRNAIRDILEANSQAAVSAHPKLLVIVGPCSIHDPSAAMDYAVRLKAAATKHRSELLIAMRVYVEKPRTTVGWKGLLHDPDLLQLPESNLDKGLHASREIMLRVSELGLPVVTEILTPFAVPFFEDLLACGIIGARTTESQTHRELSSDTPLAIGFKNGTDGTLGSALDAMKSAAHPHTLLAVDEDGALEQRVSKGNVQTFAVLRGGKAGPNFSAEHVAEAEKQMLKAGQPPRIVVDCSHGNSMKDYRKQPLVAGCVAEQVAAGSSIRGVMIESNINAGRQDIPANLEDLKYGVSVTDGCIDFAETLSVLDTLADSVRLGWARKDLDAQMAKNTAHFAPMQVEKLAPSVQIAEAEVFV